MQVTFRVEVLGVTGSTGAEAWEAPRALGHFRVHTPWELSVPLHYWPGGI